MFENISFDEKYEHDKEDFIEEFEHKPLLLSIPKIEPLFSNISVSNEDTTNIDKLSIPFTTPYKVKDPIILLEKCDKIWETLKMIRNVQDRNKNSVLNTLSLEITTAKSTNILNDNMYIEYQPVLGNNSAGVPNFKLCVRNKKTLYQCVTCGKQYTAKRTLRYHSQKIHGIYLPTKYKYKKSALQQKGTDKVKEKDSNIVEKKMNSGENVSSKKAENKQCAKSSLHRKSLPTNNIIVSEYQSHKRKRSLTYTNSHVSTNGTMKNVQEKIVLNKEMIINEKISSLQNNTVLSTCVLCKQSIRDMRKHLIDYHKIESPDFMLEKLDERLNVSEGNKLKTNIFTNENETLNEITQEQQTNSLYFQNERRRKSNVQYTNSRKRHKAMSDESSQIGENDNLQVKENDNLQIEENDKRKCDICLGLYKLSSYFKHMQIHRRRGETKQNFHLSTKKYVNSPLYQKSRINSKINDMFFENTKHNVKDNSDPSKNKERKDQIMQSETKDKKVLDIFTCSCGRSFRNSHTLFTHKKYCISSEKIKLSITESNVNKSSHCIIQSGSDRHSGTGLSTTVKKKDNSFKIIDKDNGSGSKLQDIRHSKVVSALLDTFENNAQIELQNNPYEILELSKYSEKHSILKIESVNEDIDIDIEGNSEANFSNNISSSTYEELNNSSQERMEPTIKIEQDHKSYQENIRVNFDTKYNICVCGYQFYTKKAFEIHVDKHHSGSKLLCGYCKANFLNAIEWNKHLCSVNEGKKFIVLPMEMNCHYCNVTLNTYKKFDEHMKHKHFDPMVPYHCFQCQKQFATKTARRVHFQTEHKVTICSICNNKCLNFMKSRHKAYHYGLGFPCHFCKRSYTSKKHLSGHYKAVHNKISDSPMYDLNKLSSMNSTIS